MKIFTGNFSNLKLYLENNLIPISIAGKAPIYYNGLQYKKLAPKYWFFDRWKNGQLTNNEYVKYFDEEVLYPKDQYDVFCELFNLVLSRYSNKSEKFKEISIILLCYEKYRDFCHRYLVSSWLNKINEFNVIEFRE